MTLDPCLVPVEVVARTCTTEDPTRFTTLATSGIDQVTTGVGVGAGVGVGIGVGVDVGVGEGVRVGVGGGVVVGVAGGKKVGVGIAVSAIATQSSTRL